jgi:hypothetical protein
MMTLYVNDRWNDNIYKLAWRKLCNGGFIFREMYVHLIVYEKQQQKINILTKNTVTTTHWSGMTSPVWK